ncbi:hypothetical protein GCM10020256_26800 [Streptomyces thermocoprophilus]
MDLIALGLALLTAAGVLGVFTGIRMYRADAKLPGDLALALEVGSTRTGAVDSVIDRMGMRWAPTVLRLMGPKLVARVRRKIDLAGNPGGLTIDRYAARRAVYGALGGVGCLIFLLRGNYLIALLLLAFAAFWTEVGIWAAIRVRRDVIERTLPDFLDVLAVVVSAGLGFRQALDRVASHYEGPWADEIRITLRQMDLGMSRRQAFAELRRRNDSEQVAMFVTALQQGEELGAPHRRHPGLHRQGHAPHRRPERAPQGRPSRPQGHADDHHVHGPGHDAPPRRGPAAGLGHGLRVDHRGVRRAPDMTQANARQPLDIRHLHKKTFRRCNRVWDSVRRVGRPKSRPGGRGGTQCRSTPRASFPPNSRTTAHG